MSTPPATVTRKIHQAAQGDRDAVEWLWNRYVRLLYAMAGDNRESRIRSGAGDTSDLVAEAGLKFLRENFFEGIQDRRHFHKLLRRVISGKAIDFNRREILRATEPSESLTQVPLFDQSMAIVDITDLFAQLPATLYETATTYMEAGNEQEASRILNLTRYALRKQLLQIRDVLMQHLGNAD